MLATTSGISGIRLPRTQQPFFFFAFRRIGIEILAGAAAGETTA